MDWVTAYAAAVGTSESNLQGVRSYVTNLVIDDKDKQGVPIVFLFHSPSLSQHTHKHTSALFVKGKTTDIRDASLAKWIFFHNRAGLKGTDVAKLNHSEQVDYSLIICEEQITNSVLFLNYQ